MAGEVENRMAQLEQIKRGVEGAIPSAGNQHTADMQRLRVQFRRIEELGGTFTTEMLASQLMDIVREAENKRVQEIRAAERMERQAAASRAKAEGFSAFKSVVFSVVAKYVAAAEREAAEEAMLAEIDPDAGESAEEEQSEKKRRKKRKK